MTLSSALNIVDSSFRAIGVQSATIAGNIANANTAGYSRETANLATVPDDGVMVASTTRAADKALTTQLDSATSDSAMQSAISDGIAQLAQTVSDSSSSTASGALQNGASPSAMLGQFQSALTTLQAQPSSLSAAQAAVTAAKGLASALNAGAQAVTSVRTDADQAIAQGVATVNTLLQQFTSVNNSVISGLASGANVGSLEDQRDSLVSQISQQIGVNTSINSNGSMAIFTDSGATLFENAPSTLTFSASGTLGPNATGAAVLVNGAPITGGSAGVSIQSGAIAGYVQLRDVVAPQYQSQLDQIAGNLISATQETDQSTSNPGLPTQPGLFTTPGATSVPSPATWTGLANAITVNASVDPTQGGDATLLRDGGISSPNSSDYDYNPTGAAGYTGRIAQISAALTAPASFATSAGLGASASISDYSNASVSWLQGQNQTASANSTYQQSLLTQAQSALSNGTGVNLDAELTNMLTIESSYTASAKLLTTVQTMLTSLVNAV